MTAHSLKKHFKTNKALYKLKEDEEDEPKRNMLLGAWKMGVVMDTSASRIFVPSGSSGAKLLRRAGTSAITLGVNPEWMGLLELVKMFDL